MMPTMNTVELFLIAMSLIFALPWLFWRLGRTDDWAPLVVVQILTGILLGPGLLGAAWPEGYGFVFRPEVIQSLNGIAWWSVMLFVFLAGLELDLKAAWADRRQSLTTAGLALLLPLLAGCAAGAVLLWTSASWLGAAATPWQFVAGIGMACAVTALPILVLFMEKLDLLHRPLGQRVLRYASLDDIAIWTVLALILLDWNRVGRQLAFTLAFVPAALAFRALLGRVPERDRWYLALIWLAVVSLGADWAGLHYMVGAFIAGAVIDAERFDRRALDSLRHHVLLIGMPVFFLSTGLRTQWELGGINVFLAALLLLVAAVGGKLAGVDLAGRLLRWPPGEARLIGWLLQTKALIMIIFANILLDRQVIASDTFTALLLMAVMSTMLTVPMVRPSLSTIDRR